jgi:hypothetical protein
VTPTAACDGHRPVGLGLLSPRRLLLAPLPFVVVGGVWLSLRLEAVGVPLPGCVFKGHTGLDCPGCGMTRASAALIRGDVFAAAGHNALFFPTVVMLLWLWFAALSGRSPGFVAHRHSIKAVFLVAGSFMLMRNLPVSVFEFLSADG